MKTIIDETTATVTVVDREGREEHYALSSAKGFKAASDAWLRAGWDNKYVYSFTWFGRPIIQLPEDMIRIQEVIWTQKLDVIVETGVAHGGSLVYYATLFEAMGNGRVIGVDIDIREHNRIAINKHPMSKRIDLIEGSSIELETILQVKSLIKDSDKVMVILDSNHSREHVLNELRAYADIVPVGGYLVATDGIMQQVAGAPRSQDDWITNNPQAAARQFVADSSKFIIEEPRWLFNEGTVRERVTYWPSCFIKRVH